ncbi:MAG: hypothetical protein AB2541_05875 [Candidatus Thiodiazotropha sp.]
MSIADLMASSADRYLGETGPFPSANHALNYSINQRITCGINGNASDCDCILNKKPVDAAGGDGVFLEGEDLKIATSAAVALAALKKGATKTWKNSNSGKVIRLSGYPLLLIPLPADERDAADPWQHNSSQYTDAVHLEIVPQLPPKRLNFRRSLPL